MEAYDRATDYVTKIRLNGELQQLSHRRNRLNMFLLEVVIRQRAGEGVSR